jgi:hypothetical protein
MSKRWANNGPTFTKGKLKKHKPMTDEELAAWHAQKAARQQEVEERAAKSREAHKLVRTDPLGLLSGRRGFRTAVNGEAYEAIAVSSEAYEAFAATPALGTVAYEVDAEGERWIWIEAAVLDALTALRGPGEKYSEVIMRVAAAET